MNNFFKNYIFFTSCVNLPIYIYIYRQYYRYMYVYIHTCIYIYILCMNNFFKGYTVFLFLV